MEIPLLTDIFVLFSVAIVVLFICTKLRVPAIVGFLVTGVLVGPYGIALVSDIHAVEVMAEIGVVLLLFSIGIEFSFRELMRIRKAVLLGGTLQVFLVFLAGMGFAFLAGLTPQQGVFTGFILSLSSTAITLKLLQQRAEIDAPQGRTSLGILIFQDIIVVPMMLVIPILSGSSKDIADSWFEAVKALGIVGGSFAAFYWLVPKFLHVIARTRDRELFLLTVVVVCLAVAWTTNQVGLSLALGAFLAGLIISESEYSHHALGNILPFKDLFTTFFFISIGMLLDIRIVYEQPAVVLLFALGVLAIKFTVGAAATYALGYPLRTMILVGFSLSQVGEFSFVLAKSGLEHGLMDAGSYQLFLAVTVLTMAATPFLIQVAPYMAERASKLKLPERLRSGASGVMKEGRRRKENHIVIIGYGINGRNLARAARFGQIPYEVIEMNPDVVRAEKAGGIPIWYGDASQPAVLENVNIETAHAAVIAVSDPIATRKIAATVRQMNPHVYLIVRTRYVQELKPLYDLGASLVVPEEFETSIQIFSTVLREYGLSEENVDKLVEEVRFDNYKLFSQLQDGLVRLETALPAERDPNEL